ncbi:hypothetical protein [Arthrobacter sp. PsM3]|uniref:hypothetical protein n=1 Tax=Arthrobacter sp. PsM3 TaxID=3030531 RepID=UPI00263ABE26|nr:hypothetical protein [Arthrobacter sp. PsM3]MDN4645295.1 hypothetical protein [Arthrobacter sp. PsM3]
MQQQAPATQGTEPPQAVDELYLPRGGTDPDFYFPANRGHRPGRVSRWVNRLRAARSNRLPASAPRPDAPQ